MTLLQAIVLGALQGLTEFFPVSSSGHLVIAQHLFGIEGEVLAFDVAVHCGTLLAVIVIFRTTLLRLIRESIGALMAVIRRKDTLTARYQSSDTVRMAIGVIIGTIPAGLVGVLGKDAIEGLFLTTIPVSLALLFTGCVLVATARLKPGDRRLGIAVGLLIGCAQAVAITPGISRSGMTIAAALFLGVPRAMAGEFSFILSIPAILGATLLSVGDAMSGDIGIPAGVIAAGVSAAFLTGWVSLTLLMRIVKQGKIAWFAPWCWIVGTAGLLAAWLG